MNVVDANVLIYAVNTSDPRRDEAAAWLDSSLGGAETVGFAWPVLLAFLRLVTHPTVFPRPLDIDQAVATVRSWMGQPGCVMIEPTVRHLDVLAGLLTSIGAGGNVIADAHLAALAIEHAATVVSYDSDFSRFPGVRWRRPDS